MAKSKKAVEQVDLVTQEMLLTFNNASEGKRMYDPLRASLLDAWKRKVPTEDGPAVLNVVPKADRQSVGYKNVCDTMKKRYPELAGEITQLEEANTDHIEQHTVTVKLKTEPVTSVLKPDA